MAGPLGVIASPGGVAARAVASTVVRTTDVRRPTARATDARDGRVDSVDRQSIRMGGGASTAIPASDAVIEARKDGTRAYRVKVLEAVPVGLTPGAIARLAICEEELQLLAARGPIDDAPVLARFDYRAIPSWTITPRTFCFKFRPVAHRRFLIMREPEPGPESEPETEPQAVAQSDAPVSIRLATLQAAQVSAVLREHCYKKADEIRRLKAVFTEAAFAELLETVRKTGLAPIRALGDERAALDDATAHFTHKRKTAFLITGDLAPPAPEFYPLTSQMAAELVATQQHFDQVEAAVLLHRLLADPRNFDLVLDTFETDVDRDNVCHRLNVPFVKSA